MANAADRYAQSLTEIADYHNDAVDSLKLFFSTLIPRNDLRYLGFSSREIETVLTSRITETELRSALAVLSSVEAALRIDYLLRSTQRKKDPLSREFRGLYKMNQERVALSEDILGLWLKHHPELRSFIGELRAALHFRHWLAHGRYWDLKAGRKYDYAGVYLIAYLIFEKFRSIAIKVLRQMELSRAIRPSVTLFKAYLQ